MAGVGVVLDVGKFGFVSFKGRVFGGKNLGFESLGGEKCGGTVIHV